MATRREVFPLIAGAAGLLPATWRLVERPRSRAATTASATSAGVVEKGAGVIPRVIRPTTNPGRTSSSETPEPCSASASPEANPSSPALAEP